MIDKKSFRSVFLVSDTDLELLCKLFDTIEKQLYSIEEVKKSDDYIRIPLIGDFRTEEKKKILSDTLNDLNSLVSKYDNFEESILNILSENSTSIVSKDNLAKIKKYFEVTNQKSRLKTSFKNRLKKLQLSNKSIPESLDIKQTMGALLMTLGLPSGSPEVKDNVETIKHTSENKVPQAIPKQSRNERSNFNFRTEVVKEKEERVQTPRQKADSFNEYFLRLKVEEKKKEEYKTENLSFQMEETKEFVKVISNNMIDQDFSYNDSIMPLPDIFTNSKYAQTVDRDLTDSQLIIDKIIDSTEGGYMLPSRYPNNPLLAKSGETMFGIDRRWFGADPVFSEFWGLIDAQDAKNKWRDGYKGGILNSKLKELAGIGITKEYKRLMSRYLSKEQIELVESDGRLKYMFMDAVYNGQVFFRYYANEFKKALKLELKDSQLILDQIDARRRVKDSNGLISVVRYSKLAELIKLKNGGIIESKVQENIFSDSPELLESFSKSITNNILENKENIDLGKALKDALEMTNTEIK